VTPPVVIAFFGAAPPYLQVALRSADARGNAVVLVGSRVSRGAWPEHADTGLLSLPKLDTFMRVYRKMSDFPEQYEAAFWRRPFAIEAWMRAEGVSRAFILDSDVVTFADYGAEVLPLVPEHGVAGLMTQADQGPFDWATSLHFSYWTLDALSSFTSFCVEAYRDPAIRRRLEAKYQWHLDSGAPGGICEMTTLHLWRERHAARVVNFAAPHAGLVADHGIGSGANAVSGEYATRLGLKRFTFHRGRPHARHLGLGTTVRFLCVHCQGAFKLAMPYLRDPILRPVYAEAYHARAAVAAARAAAGSWRRSHGRRLAGTGAS
jgi:hypothetical protein